MGSFILALMLSAPIANDNTITTEMKYTKEQITAIKNTTNDNQCVTCTPYLGNDPNMK